MQSATGRPQRRGTRPKTILRGVGSATTSLALLVSLLSGTANAADAEPKADAPAGDADKDKDKEKDKADAPAGDASPASDAGDSGGAKPDSAPSVEAKPTETPQATPAADDAKTPAPPGDIARLPPEAYPSEPIRGIYGGSLWLTFHGQQWPTAPFHTDPPRTQLGLSGSAWVDTGYKSITTGDQSAHDKQNWVHQGRFTLRATPTYTKGDLFVQAQGELVAANSDEGSTLPAYAMRTDDLWVRAGQWKKWDVQVGRYQAWEIYHYGMGLDQNTLERVGAYNMQNIPPKPIYGVDYLYDRPVGLGNVALHVYPMKFLRAELLAQAGYAGQANSLGGRPALILDFGMIKLKGAVEMKLIKGDNDNSKQDEKYRGGGGAVQVILDPRVEFGVNGAYGNTDIFGFDGTKSLTGSVDTYSVGGFANARIVGPVIFGVGANYTRLDDTQVNPNGEHGEFSHFQSFAALQAIVIEQLFIKAVFGYARADFAPATGGLQPWHDTAVSGRLRLMYLF
ncbi:MAG: hypothetical protein QM756_23390 [Polyangiaceae bacterium]